MATNESFEPCTILRQAIEHALVRRICHKSLFSNYAEISKWIIKRYNY